jgi:hypothetical protein
VTTFGVGDEGALRWIRAPPSPSYYYLRGITMDDEGHLYITDCDNCLSKITLADGHPIGTPHVSPIVDNVQSLAPHLRHGMYFVSRY